MRRRRRRAQAAAAAVGLAGAVALLAAVTGLFAVGGGGSGSTGKVNLGDIAGTVVSGASAVLVAPREAAAGALRLRVALPAGVISPATGSGPLATDANTAAVYAGAGWRGAMIASIAATRVPGITQFVTTDKVGGQAPGASFYLDGSVRTTPGQKLAVMPMIDRVAPARERRQLDDNIRSLIGGLPRGSVLRASVRQIVVDPAADGMAYAVSLRVRDLRRLRYRLGDIFDGLATGLAPGSDSTVEGLAIHVEDTGGRGAGSWIATRAAQGTTVIDRRIHVPRVMVLHIHFPNETGGPEPLASAPAGPVG
jgi:hypothetical protein